MNYVESNKAGCPWVVEIHRDAMGGLFDEHCNRIPSPTSAYCPKHELMDAERENENKRSMEKVRRREEKKALYNDLLKTSPLRVAAVDEVKTGYEQ